MSREYVIQAKAIYKALKEAKNPIAFHFLKMKNMAFILIKVVCCISKK